MLTFIKRKRLADQCLCQETIKIQDVFYSSFKKLNPIPLDCVFYDASKLFATTLFKRADDVVLLAVCEKFDMYPETYLNRDQLADLCISAFQTLVYQQGSRSIALELVSNISQELSEARLWWAVVEATEHALVRRVFRNELNRVRLMG